MTREGLLQQNSIRHHTRMMPEDVGDDQDGLGLEGGEIDLHLVQGVFLLDIPLLCSKETVSIVDAKRHPSLVEKHQLHLVLRLLIQNVRTRLLLLPGDIELGGRELIPHRLCKRCYRG